MAAASTVAIVAGSAVAAGLIGSQIAGANAASDQAEATQQVLAEQISARERALGIAAPTYNELTAINQQLLLSKNANERALMAVEREQAILDAVDPAIREAGTQALQLLQGKDAAILTPIKAQRADQRRQLEQTLADRLGGGFETSSAGIAALRDFDTATGNLIAGAQQESLGQLLGTSIQGRSLATGSTENAFGTANQSAQVALGAMHNLKARSVNAFIGSPVNYSPFIEAAGVGAKNTQQTFGALGSIGGAGLGYAGMASVFGNQGSGGGGGNSNVAMLWNPNNNNAMNVA